MPPTRAPRDVSNSTRILPEGLPAHPAGDRPGASGLLDVRALPAPGWGHMLPRAAGERSGTWWIRTRTAVLDHRRRSRVPVSLHRVTRRLVRARGRLDRPRRGSPSGPAGPAHSHGPPTSPGISSILWGRRRLLH